MGLFDMSKGGNMGFASVENVKNFTNEDLLAKLSEVNVSFGTPVMGDINGTQSVMYKNVTDAFDVFVRVDKKNVIMGKIGADGVSSVTSALNMGLDLFLGSKDEGTSTADRAVDELLGVIKKLEAGETVTESTAATVETSTGSAICLYMKQKVLAIKPKFDIFDQNENTVYHVEGDITRLSFSIQKSGMEVLKLKKKLVAIMPEYTIEKGGKEIAKIKKKFKLTSPELNGTVEGQELKIAGDIMGFDFDILVGDKAIG
ncbi:MAG: LURP-one-related family protein, partial [Lachnospiraceae bacterium]|nr:LURP-one-related family protein [Lachnospiraceae bacterium]